MIRRDMRLPSGDPAWMLISQIEHARLSAELATHCSGCFDAPAEAAVREQVVAAILHHDDGWAEWEESPQLDPANGRPLTFTELAPRDAMEIWEHSIAAAATLGPLAGWMVAGHFLRLTRIFASVPLDPTIAAWQDATAEKRRRAWLAAWQNADKRVHTSEIAAAALEWLWTFDEASLWLCCTCLGDEPIPCAPQPYRAGRGTRIEMELSTAGPAAAVAQPWRFDRESLDLAIGGLVIPAVKYDSPARVLAAEVPEILPWRLSAEKNLLETAPKPRS